MLSIPPFYKPSIKKRKNGNNRKRTKGRSFTHVPVLREVTRERANELVDLGKKVYLKEIKVPATILKKQHTVLKYFLDTGKTKVIINKPENKKIIKFPNV